MATKTIGATGRDYATLSAWIAYLDALTFAGAEIGQAYNDGEFGEGLNFVSGITNGSNRITLTAAAGQSFADHASKTTNALKYNVGNGAGALGTTGGGGSTIIVDIAHLTITRMQFKRTANYNYLLEMTGGSSDGIFTDCIFHQFDSGLACAVLNTAVTTSCLFICDGTGGTGSSVGVRHLGACADTNCTIVRTKGGTAAALAAAYGTCTMINTAVFGFSSIVDSGTFAGSNNASNLSSLGFGSANQTSLTYASQFAGVTTGSEDFRALASGSLDNAGTATGAPATDIIGQTRAATPWIGAHEVVGGGGGGGGGGQATQVITGSSMMRGEDAYRHVRRHGFAGWRRAIDLRRAA